MNWTEDGRIQITGKFALAVATTIVGLALVMMLLIGMLIAGDGDGDPQAEIDPTPSVMAAEEEIETPTAKPQAAEQREEISTPQTTDPQNATPMSTASPTGTKTEYSTCLVRTQRTLALDAENARFTPWPDYGDNRSVWDVIRYRHIDYIGDHCRDVAPPPPSTYSSTCIPRELQSFYRRHIPEGADNDTLRAIAGEYALTVCQPSAER